ncbi:branched-chain amino acid ABC transporter permease [Variovorax sp. HW608]|uniref:branched-chain amino acid ABC transporter permease n=1 Tax=Variovorax sp. HW608 TaxID=1034889 RepID=UPI0018D52070|nr:branched-chain amino acid ABC transporter permease [Variovorax sp. HW608]
MLDRQSLALRASHLLTAGLFGAAALFAMAAHLLGDTFYIRLATEAFIFGGLALSVDLLLGCTGLLSLGQAMYFGLGAYASALVLMSNGSFWAAVGAGAGVCLVSGTVFGLVALRVRGVYFALITFALALVVAKLVYNTRALGGSDGLIGVPLVEIPLVFASTSTGNAPGFLLVAALLMLTLYVVIALLLGTPFGRMLVALRANEGRIAYLGYSVSRARMAVYVLASVVAGVAGTLYPMLRGFTSPDLLYFGTSGNALIAVIVGGVGTLTGAFWGSAILVLLKSIVGSYTTHHVIVIGTVFMLVVLFLPHGILALARDRLVRRLGRASVHRLSRLPVPSTGEGQ